MTTLAVPASQLSKPICCEQLLERLLSFEACLYIWDCLQQQQQYAKLATRITANSAINIATLNGVLISTTSETDSNAVGVNVGDTLSVIVEIEGSIEVGGDVAGEIGDGIWVGGITLDVSEVSIVADDVLDTKDEIGVGTVVA